MSTVPNRSWTGQEVCADRNLQALLTQTLLRSSEGHMALNSDIIERIVEQNLGVYEAAPSRLKEDVSQEAQVASDYRGRLVYELLQNADDAMAESSSGTDRVSFLVTDSELWIANSGRSLTE